MLSLMMPTNLYGRGDNYYPEYSHSLPVFLRRFHEAKLENRDSVTIWGTYTPRRELMNVDDLASAAIHVLKLDNPPDLVNAGTGIDHSIREIAEIVKEVAGRHDRHRSQQTGRNATQAHGHQPARIARMVAFSFTRRNKDTYLLFIEEFERGNLSEA